jgi:hypothetical protein
MTSKSGLQVVPTTEEDLRKQVAESVQDSVKDLTGCDAFFLVTLKDNRFVHRIACDASEALPLLQETHKMVLSIVAATLLVGEPDSQDPQTRH